MTYAKIIDGAAAAYPYSFAQLKADNPQTSFPRGYDMAQHEGVVEVQPVERPAITAAQTISEGSPELVDGVWRQVWIVRDLTAEELQALVPDAITMPQARLTLLGAGLLATVDQAIASMSGVEGEVARIKWEYALKVRRDSPLIASLGPALGLTSEQIDALFVAGAGL